LRARPAGSVQRDSRLAVRGPVPRPARAPRAARGTGRRGRPDVGTRGEGHGDEAHRGRLVADFRAFLGPKEPVVLPYFGGTRVDSAGRRLRVEDDLARGWWRFRIEGRRAVPVEPASPPVLDALPKVAGHWVLGWIAS